jgi:hypothetical protein
VRNIKTILKTLVITTIISMGNVILGYADVNSIPMSYVVNQDIKDNGIAYVKLNDGSWYSSDKIANKYVFFNSEVNQEISFCDDFELAGYIKRYQNSKFKLNEIPKIVKDNLYILGNVEKHSNKNYSNDLYTNEDLEEYSRQWLKDNYNLTLNIDVEYCDFSKIDNTSVDNDTLGVFFTRKNKALIIYINQDIKDFNIIVERVLLHELTHYSLFSIGKPYKDVDDYFKNECEKYGTISNKNYIGIFHSNLKSTL